MRAPTIADLSPEQLENWKWCRSQGIPFKIVWRSRRAVVEPQPLKDQSIDPRAVRWHHNNLNQKAVQQYYERGKRPWWDDMPDGPPTVVKNRGGALRGTNGRHRAEAAMLHGKPLDGVTIFFEL